MAWVKWDQILLPYEFGGLNVNSLKLKNLSLLTKWWWRFLTNENTFWVRIIKSIYGVNGNGEGTSFWRDKWIGDSPLCATFPRLFRLEEEKDASISDRVCFSDSGIVFNWSWSTLPGWRAADELASLTAEIEKFKFSNNQHPSWTWKFNPNGLFSTESLMHHLNSLAAATLGPLTPTVLNSSVPQKIGIFIWRAKQNKLPVRTELDKKDIDLDFVRCPVCDDDVETLLHSLVRCANSIDIWDRIKRWWNLDQLHITSLSDLANVSNAQISTNLGSALWQSVVWITSYYIWLHSNDRAFGKKNLSTSKIVSEIQSKSFEWINSRWKKGNLDWSKWLTNPRWFDAIHTKVGIG
ncbi:uncharacterized protein [Rutidosis leptorrhynchoides]|uniref:uncharacterized protein n=1 Tax=Rutidosis leptorrhynchoides TaxID=125765 RepID=UPI003A9A5929